MEFVSINDFAVSQRKAQEKLAFHGALVLTNNGVPSMLVIDITGKDFVKLINNLRKQEAIDILRKVQVNSVKNGKDAMSMEEIDAEIAAYRNERKMMQ